MEIIKKFIFDFLRLIDEYRKEKRRRDFSSSDEDDSDPFQNKSPGLGFSRARFNATPASSTIKADSIAGRSRASTIKGGQGPVSISAGGKAAPASTPGEMEFQEDVGGIDEYHTRLKELWAKRTQLMKVTKKRGKKKKRGRSALKRTTTSAFETETNWDDDKTSFMTTNELAQNQDFMVGLIDDTIKLVQNPRKFKAHLPILETLGIDNYDQVPSMDKLVFTMTQALTKFQKLWLTLDKDEIYQKIRLCMARELTMVEERKDAAEYALKRPKSFDFFDDPANVDLSAVKSASWGQSSPSRMGSPSPNRKQAPTGQKTGGRDLNTTGFELKSIGESDGRGRPVAFKDPPMLKTSLAAPTAEKLKRLNTKAGEGGPKSDGGAKSARRSEVSAGRIHSRRSNEPPANPYEEHTVEQMDVLIDQHANRINDLANKIKVIANDSLATKTTKNAKKKPLVEEMTMLRFKLMELQQIREDKIPDHEKLPKDCIFYKHFLQVDTNTKIQKAADEQIREDKELLQGIAQNLSPVKRRPGDDPELNVDLAKINR